MSANEKETLEAHLLYDIPEWALARGWIEVGKDGTAKVSRKGKEWIEKQISNARLSQGSERLGSEGLEAL